MSELPTIGLLLSGPLGLAAARSDFSRCLADGFNLIATVAETPGMLTNYAYETGENLRAQGIKTWDYDSVLTASTYLVCVGWRSLIHFDFPLENCFVVHDSLLPALRGWNPLVTAVELGLEETGISLIQANDRPDTGPLLIKKKFQLGPGVPIDEAISRAQACVTDLMQEFTENFNFTRSNALSQDESSASLSPWRDESDYRIDWSKSALDVQQFVLSRSFPYKGATSLIEGKEVLVDSAAVRSDLPELAIKAPGKVVARENDKHVVACGTGYVAVTLLERETRRVLKLEKFRVRLT